MRAFLVGILVVVGLAAGPQPAEALIWDWLQELSGPGPSRGHFKSVLATLCPANGTINSRDYVPNSRVPCVFFDVRGFKNEDDDNFPARVRTWAYDAGPVWELGSAGQIEVGAGIGLMHFKGANDASDTRLTITVARLVVQPLSLAPRLATEPWAAIFKVYLRHTLIPDDLDATDFGVPFGTGPGESTFAVEHDQVTSIGILIDVGELLRGRF